MVLDRFKRHLYLISIPTFQVLGPFSCKLQGSMISIFIEFSTYEAEVFFAPKKQFFNFESLDYLFYLLFSNLFYDFKIH